MSAPSPSWPKAAARADGVAPAVATAALSSSPPRPPQQQVAADFALLSSSSIDLNRWINAVISHQHSERKAGTNGAETVPAEADEETVSCILQRVQKHAQQVGADVEELISQAIVRLPRTTMELTRMIEESNELSVKLQAMRDAAQPAVHAGSEGHVQRLNGLKGSQERLRRCESVLAKAAAVDASTTRIALSIQELQREQRSGSSASKASVNGDGANGVSPSASSSARTSVAALSTAIRDVKKSLKELQQIDATYGEKYKVALEQYEQVIEQVLEHDCLEYLSSHDAVRAAELLRPLQLIGRAEVVLQGYAKRVTAPCVDLIAQVLGSERSSSVDSTLLPPPPSDTPSTALVTAAQAAEGLQQRVIPVVRASLESELNFLFALADCMRDAAKFDGTANVAAKKTSTAVAANAGSSSSGGDGETDERAEGEKPLQAMAYITDNIVAAYRGAMVPILRRATSNEAVIACSDAVRQVKVPSAPPPASTATTTAAAALAGLSARERATTQASTRALNAFMSVFQSDEVITAFSERTAERLQAAVRTSAADDSAASRLLAYLQSAQAQAAVSGALAECVADVLRFLPDRVLEPCLRQWSRILSSLFGPLLAPVAETAGASRPSTTTPCSSPPQAVTLVRLSLIAKCVRPRLQELKKSAEALLASTVAQQQQQQLASTVNTIQTGMATAVWAPLMAAVDSAVAEGQQLVEQSVLAEIVSRIDGYETLPAWGRRVGATTGGSEAEASATALSAVVEYTPGHATPSEAVRSFGEAIMGTPLALESLREESQSVDGALSALFSAHTYTTATTTTAAALNRLTVSPAFAAEVRDGLNDLLDEKSALWLDNVVSAAVDVFVTQKIRRVRVDFSPLLPPSSQGGVRAPPGAEATASALKRVQLAWEMLAADLEYLKNILSAVSEEQYSVLEDAIATIRALPPATDTTPFVVGDKLKDVAQQPTPE